MFSPFRFCISRRAAGISHHTPQVHAAHNLRSRDPEAAWYIGYRIFGMDVSSSDVNEAARDDVGGSCVAFNHTSKHYIRCSLAALQRYMAMHSALDIGVFLRRPTLRGRYGCSLRRAFDAAELFDEDPTNPDPNDGCMPASALLYALRSGPEVGKALVPLGFNIEFEHDEAEAEEAEAAEAASHHHHHRHHHHHHHHHHESHADTRERDARRVAMSVPAEPRPQWRQAERGS